MRSLPAPKSDFIGLDGTVHLATGGEPPLLRAHRDAFEAFARDKANGMDGYRTHWATVDAVRAALGRLTGLDAGDIALTGSASEAITKVVSGFDWRPGDNVVVSALDYASGRYAFAGLQRHGVEARMVPARGWSIGISDLLAACDTDTRLIYVSQVNALTGQHLDIAALSDGLKDTDTAMMVDASHAIGAVPVDGTLCDFLVSCCYKFLLGVHDGILGWNRRRWPDFVPSGVGWHAATAGPEASGYTLKPDAQRAEFGNVDHLGAYLLRASLDYLAGVGIDAIAAHVRARSARLVAGMSALGLEVMTPEAADARAANAAFACPDPAAVVRSAREHGILVWGDNGRVRASAHLFTTDADIDRFLERLPTCLS